jgi:hypothetical protein
MPLVSAVDDLLSGRVSVDALLEQFLARPPRLEAN